jgi:hypothetical protein
MFGELLSHWNIANETRVHAAWTSRLFRFFPSKREVRSTFRLVQQPWFESHPKANCHPHFNLITSQPLVYTLCEFQ